MNSNRNFSLDINKELLMTSSSTNTPIDYRRSTYSTPYPQRSGISEALLLAVEYHRNMQVHTTTRESNESSESINLYRRHGSVESRCSTSPFFSTNSLGENSQTIDTYSTPYPQKCYGISEALLQTVECHWNTQQLHTPTSESDESSEPSSLDSDPIRSDENLDRPFKKFRRETIESQSDSNSSGMNSCPMDVKEDETFYRPLNVYGRESIKSQSRKNYMTFRSKWLQEMNNSNSRQLIVSNPNMRRTSLGNQPGSSKDAAYYEKRQKNNLASKQSRDRRKMKQVDVSIRIAFLEKENMQLETLLDQVKARIKTIDASAAQQ